VEAEVTFSGGTPAVTVGRCAGGANWRLEVSLPDSEAPGRAPSQPEAPSPSRDSDVTSPTVGPGRAAQAQSQTQSQARSQDSERGVTVFSSSTSTCPTWHDRDRQAPPPSRGWDSSHWHL
jgi:hypothetical protein